MAKKSAAGNKASSRRKAPPPAGDVLVFVSWSGERSKALAEALADWIRLVMPEVEPWVSSQDIQAGTRWGRELDGALATRNIGVLCLTAENLSAPWILFEAGCLAKSVADSNRVIPYLLGVSKSEVTPPLSQFQAVVADRDGTLSLVRSINGVRPQPLDGPRLAETFEVWWPKLEKKVAGIPADERADQPRRADRELLEEVLELVRRQSRGSAAIPTPDSAGGLAPKQGGGDHEKALDYLRSIVTRLRNMNDKNETFNESDSSHFARVIQTIRDHYPESQAIARLADTASELVLYLSF